MSSNPLSNECVVTPVQPFLKRASSYASVTKISSSKRRRISMASSDFARELRLDSAPASTLSPAASLDRFIPSRPKNSIPLNATPRSNRISRQFGLTDDRVFNFSENNQEHRTSNADGTNMFSLLRRSVSSLFHSPPRSRPTSVTENLTKRKQCVLTLDGPGIPRDPYAVPITWSKRNLIAVACGNDVYYQNLNSRVVSHLCKLDVSEPGKLQVIEWAGEGKESILASGSSTGVVQVWDAGQDGGAGRFMRMWWEHQSTGVGGLDWNGDLLAVGSYDGTISLFDMRSKSEARRVSAHKGKVLGLKWSTDGTLIASGDDLGMVYIWDKRAGKELLEQGTQGAKMRHRGPVKALAWCPWKPDLLATGSIHPEGKIRIWSSSSPSPSSTPLETISLNTSVLSLHWSPHCKELLSTHGSSFKPVLPHSRPLSAGSVTIQAPPRQELKPVASPLTNSIVVHEYPSGKRLLAHNAHFGPVTHSCLGPDGENLFTVCPKEENIKMWHVWNQRSRPDKRESAFDKCAIR